MSGEAEVVSDKPAGGIKSSCDVNEGFKSPSLISNDEFFDADDGAEVDNAKIDEEDFLKDLENAISGNELQASKQQLEVVADPKTNGIHIKNCDAKADSNDVDLEKMEEELLKDPEDEIESLEKKAENLLESDVPKDSEKSIKTLTNGHVVEKSVADDEDAAEEKAIEDKLLEDDDLLNEAADMLDDIMTDIEEQTETSECISKVASDLPIVDKAVHDDELLPSKTVTKEDEINGSNDASKDAEEEPKADDLLVACESPKNVGASEQENTSETSSSAEDSSDEKQKDENESVDDEQSSDTKKSGESSEKTSATKQLDAMEVDDFDEIIKEKEVTAAPVIDDDEVHLCMIVDEPKAKSAPKKQASFKLNFARKFASAVGALSRAELEELLTLKITEAMMFCSENTLLRARIEKQEKNCESFKKQLENLKKQYNDLDMIHTRVKKDLKDRPDSSITPVKITRAVGLQVFSPIPRVKTNTIVQSSLLLQPTHKSTMKRPATELENQLSGKSPENAKRKKITPMRPVLSEKDRRIAESQEAKNEQKIRSTAISNVKLPDNITISSIPNGNSTALSTTASSIDLTDEEESGSNGPVQPPALVAIRAPNSTQFLQRKTYVVKQGGPAIRTQQSYGSQIHMTLSRAHPAPLPFTTFNTVLPGQKKIPPQPSIRISTVSNGIVVSWNVTGHTPDHAEITSYQIYAYEVTNAIPQTENWKHVGDVKALLLPMAVTLTQFQEGQKYYFSVRATDIHKRHGPFAVAKTWTEIKN